MSWPKITAETPIEDLEAIHGVIWQHVVDNGEKPITDYMSDCVACEYVKRRYGSGNACDFCPIDWGDLGKCSDPFSVFYMWLNAMNSKTQAGDIMAKRLAAVIRDVKFKK